MVGIIRSESSSTVENLVTFQTVWQAATYWTHPRNQVVEKFRQPMIMHASLFLLIIFFLVVWLFANPMRWKSNLFCFELVGVPVASLKQKNTCRPSRFYSSPKSYTTCFAINRSMISTLRNPYPENLVHPVKNSFQMN